MMSSSLDLILDSQDREKEKRNEQDSEDLIRDTTERGGTQEEEEEEELSAQEVVKRLKVKEGIDEAQISMFPFFLFQTFWLNEKFSPCLLSHQSDVIECLSEQIQQIENNLNRAGKNDFRIPLHKMEVARIRFMMAAYLRIRKGD